MDVAASTAFCKKRSGGDKFAVALEGCEVQVRQVLEGIQAELLEKATELRRSRTHRVETYDDFKAQLNEQGGWYLVPWCDDSANEDAIKAETKATVRCYPLDGQGEVSGRSCFYSGRPATHMAIFARAY